MFELFLDFTELSRTPLLPPTYGIPLAETHRLGLCMKHVRERQWLNHKCALQFENVAKVSSKSKTMICYTIAGELFIAYRFTEVAVRFFVSKILLVFWYRFWYDLQNLCIRWWNQLLTNVTFRYYMDISENGIVYRLSNRTKAVTPIIFLSSQWLYIYIYDSSDNRPTGNT